jgi:galactokinase
VNTLSRHDSNFSLQSATLDTAEELASHLRADEYRLLRGTLRNRDITYQALDLLRQPIMNERVFGELLNEHHAILRDVLCISTPKIEKMLTAALDAGAYGGKINGSGGGGCMFVYAPEHTERIAEAIEKAGGKAYIVNVDTGVRIESI